MCIVASFVPGSGGLVFDFFLIISGRISLNLRFQDDMMKLTIIGAGLAGCEAAWQAAESGIFVDLFEMRPKKMTGAHQTEGLAELVCSNSLGSNLPNRASGLLKAELRRLGSCLISCADASSLPAGNALAVDRDVFSACVSQKIERHPKINLIREEVTQIPSGPVILASGPLTSPELSSSLAAFLGSQHLYFFDAVAPIIQKDSIDMTIAFRADRYSKTDSGKGDYINCPFSEMEYYRFWRELVKAERIPLKVFEEEIQEGVNAGNHPFFQGCQPVEIIAEKGEKSLAFGPMRPVGLTDPRTGRWPFATVQLRQDNLAGDLYNLVGFQTNLRYSEQARVFRMIPGLESAEFVRFGKMHRNTYISSPTLLSSELFLRKRRDVFVAGQLAGVEGYAGNIASGFVAGLNAARLIQGLPLIVFPPRTMLGALMHYITHADVKDFQPTKAMFGLLPAPDDQVRRNKRNRYDYYVNRAEKSLQAFMESNDFNIYNT